MKQQESLEIYSNRTKATRHNAGKPKWGLVDFQSMEPMISVLEHGASHYGEMNWKKGLNDIEILESMQRHIAEMIDNLNEGRPLLDHDTSLPIMGHIMCNAMFFNYHHRNNSFTERNSPIKKKEDE